MSREEFAELLRAKGYNARCKGKEVVVYGINKKLYRIIESIAKKAGYIDRFTWSGKEEDAEV